MSNPNQLDPRRLDPHQWDAHRSDPHRSDPYRLDPHRSPARWKRGLLALAMAAGVALSGATMAQDLGVGWNPRSGDVWVDTWAGDINRYGTRYREPFVDELVRYHGAPRPLVIELLEERRWAPGDVYLACSIASIIGRPCRHVVDMYERDPGQGWGVVAQRLGIQPGSPEFHRLKKGFVTTYDRWARPIDLDETLRRDFPGHGKAARPAHAKLDGNAKKERPAPVRGDQRGNPAKADGGRDDRKGRPANGKEKSGKGGKEPGKDGKH